MKLCENMGSRHQGHVAGTGGAYGWNPPTQKDADPRLLSDAQDMVLRDRNHPSIVIWSLCNELGCVAGDPNGGDLAMQFKLAIYAADATRPVTGNTVQTPYIGGHRYLDPFAMAMDVQSFSYDYESYTAFHSMSPWKPVGGGESSSCQSDRGYYGDTDREKGFMSMFDTSYPPLDTTEHAGQPSAPLQVPSTGDVLGLWPCPTGPGVNSVAFNWTIQPAGTAGWVSIHLHANPKLCVESDPNHPVGSPLVLGACTAGAKTQLFRVVSHAPNGTDILGSEGCGCWNVDDGNARYGN